MDEITFLEAFSLAEDRAKVLNQLIPGTIEYYYYNCIHFLNLKQFDKTEEMLNLWKDRHGKCQKTKEIQHRQALLMYSAEPEKTIDYISRKTNTYFHHTKEVAGSATDFPERFDQELISIETLKARAIRSHRDSTDGFEKSGLLL